jgi:2-dehydropantoate 2-reductase
MSGRYVIYGAGAIGGVIGGCLSLAGHDVCLIARGEHLAAIEDRGLQLHLPEAVHTVKAMAAAGPAELDLDAGDVVILAMKTQHTETALLDLAAAAPPEIPVVCAQNGVENERLALRRFPNTYGICVLLPALHLEPGVVEGAGAPVGGVLDIGRYPRGVDDTAARVAGALAGSGFRSEPNPAIMRHKYAKLRVNTQNALEAACGPGHRDSDLWRRLTAEALEAFEAAGIDVASREEVAARRGDFKVVEVGGRPRPGGSSWQSLARSQGSVEADYLNGEVVLLGRQHGVATPVNEALRRVSNELARTGGTPGSVSIDAIEQLVAVLSGAELS